MHNPSVLSDAIVIFMAR